MYYRYLLAGVIPLASVAEVFAEAPNILFILSDDHTSQTWGIYGGILADYAITDNIRRLANEGLHWTTASVPTLYLLPVGLLS